MIIYTNFQKKSISKAANQFNRYYPLSRRHNVHQCVSQRVSTRVFNSSSRSLSASSPAPAPVNRRAISRCSSSLFSSNSLSSRYRFYFLAHRFLVRTWLLGFSERSTASYLNFKTIIAVNEDQHLRPTSQKIISENNFWTFPAGENPF